ncbi:MAG: peroxiredoxin [Bacteroidia bacterium]
MLQTGHPAPAFTMYDSEKNIVSNETIKGHKALLLFIPAAFTSTCTKEFCMIRDDISRYNDIDAKVIGISTDTIYVLRKWKEEQQINFTLASDYNKDVSAAFDAAYETFNYGMKGISKRAAFIIDADGIIRYAEVLDNASLLPDFEKINAVLEEI